MSRTAANATATGKNSSYGHWLGRDGQVVLNLSWASDLTADDNDGTSDLFANRAQSVFADDFEEGDDGALDNAALP